jgi:hypothetical protein
MEQSLQALELRRKQLHRQMKNLGDFRHGTISVNRRKCGKNNCACARKDHPGHGPQYLWKARVSGKTQARNLPLGPELEKVQKEVERYRSFVRLCQELVATWPERWWRWRQTASRALLGVAMACYEP